MRILHALVVLVAALAATPAQALEVLLLRHAETLANVQDDYSVFNQRHFSARGEAQVVELARAWSGHRFDAVLVSPAHRALRTIRPYLEQNGIVAEIWPELDECCWQKPGERSGTDTAALGGEVLVEQDMRPFFMVRSGSDGRVAAEESYADGIRRVKQVAQMIQQRYGEGDLAVLVVVHQLTGSRLAETLLGQSPDGRYRLDNASVTWLHGEAGRFSLVAENLSPAEAAARLSGAAATP